MTEIKFCDLSMDFLLSSWLCLLRGSGRRGTPAAVGTPDLDLHMPSPRTGTSQGAPKKWLIGAGAVAAEPRTCLDAEKQGSAQRTAGCVQRTRSRHQWVLLAKCETIGASRVIARVRLQHTGLQKILRICSGS